MDTDLFMKKINLPKEAAEKVREILGAVSHKEEFKALLKDIEDSADPNAILEKANGFAKNTDLNEFEFAMALIIAAANIMKRFFEEKGYSEERFFAAATDFTVKANECKELYGYYGNFVLRWSVRVIRGEIQRFGRLEFEEIPFAYEEYRFENSAIKCGDKVLSVHIPTDGPLLPWDVIESLKMAYEFYEAKYNGVMFVMCSSYLLYPPFKRLYKEGGNIRWFIDLFDIIASRETETFESAWRIFGTRDISDLNALPTDTSLRKSMAEYLRGGGSVGAGTGIFPFVNTTEFIGRITDGDISA